MTIGLDFFINIYMLIYTAYKHMDIYNIKYLVV